LADHTGRAENSDWDCGHIVAKKKPTRVNRVGGRLGSMTLKLIERNSSDAAEPLLSSEALKPAAFGRVEDDRHESV
jgi:hypothetical protein